MFTGIIEEIGTVKALGGNNLTIQGKVVLEGTKLGDSIAVNGACLTVISIARDNFTVEIMPETKRMTNLGTVRISDSLNLERAMPAQGRFGGHFVQGHVDAIGKIISHESDADAIILTFSAPGDIIKYIVRKGFVAVNGVSLTVVQCTDSTFSISMVGFTKQHTNLYKIKTGSAVNIEVDIIAKYIEKFYQPKKENGVISLLRQYDYLKAR